MSLFIVEEVRRSATVVIAALMVKDGLCYRDACAV